MNNNIIYFMYFFMYKLELILLNEKNEIKNISFQLDEANTDKPLKEFIKNIILSKCNNINDMNLKISFSNQTNSNNIEYLSNNYLNYKINKVYLPDDLTPEIKQYISSNKNCVYTEPDLCLEIVDNLSNEIFYETN